ncbi:membrane protein [Actibacterium pelagium]|uniref:Membrane protein n=2 Tax=Actibacterium pelagium TaxID=2029103 RepID=A0A917AJZ5_9RHOB|nr:membrane protein [Actibacterium pelagium]
MDTLLMPFQFGFMVNAFWVSVIIAVPTAILSCFLVLKGWSLMGDAISHAILPGVVLAYLLNIPLLIGAFFAGMTCALATGYLSGNSRVKQDTVMGVVFSGMFGLGIVMYTKTQPDVHLDHILFGNMLGVGAADLWTAGLIAVPVTLILIVKWKDLLLHAFDPAQAQTSGLPVRVLHYGLLAILSLTIVATLKAVGIILAIGLLIAPGAIAFLLTRQFSTMLIVAVGITVLSCLGGVYASFWLDSAPAPTIILILTTVFIGAFIWRSLRTRRSVRTV